jgi:hypothetical protein
LPQYNRQLTNVCTATYIHRLTDKYNALRSSVPGIFLGFGIEEYSLVIFLGTKEYTKTGEGSLFSCSVVRVLYYIL